MRLADIIALGYTKEYIDHIRQQIPGLIEESVKRIKFMPFDAKTAYIAHKLNGRSWLVLRYLCAKAGLVIPSTSFIDSVPTYWNEDLRTEINGMRRDKDHTRLISIRGHLKTMDRMPMYLEEGAYGRQYVYPIFDWSELQLMVAAMMIHEMLEADRAVIAEKEIEAAVAEIVKEEDRIWIEQIRRIIGDGNDTKH